MTARLLALAVLVALVAAGCGGETQTVTVTETQTVTVAPEGEDNPAHQLAHDVCRSLPRELVAPLVGADPNDPERLADEFAELARPELREPARDGCVSGLTE
ncbi:MAG TPA: hypothetical protein VM290_05075 [Gaiellaceae bacterium]|nr:hypothetical protein [Gaiellaceae bacterium]